jgi:hypothetical protein
LRRFELSGAEVILLSTDHFSAQEAARLYRTGLIKKCYLPLSTKNMFDDICLLNQMEYDSIQIVFYSQNSWSSGENNTLTLMEGSVIYDFEFSRIIFQDSYLGGVQKLEELFSALKQNVLVTSQFAINDTLALSNLNLFENYFISYKLPDQVLMYRDGKLYMKGGKQINVLEISQVGAVELVIKNGRFEILK